MKIIFSHYGTIDGGDACGFTRSFNLAKGLTKQQNKVFFLTTQKTGFKFPYLYENRDGVDIYAFPEIFPNAFRKGGLSLFSMIFKVIFVIFTKADIVHSDTGHRPNSGIPCLIHRLIYKSCYFSEWWEHFGKGGIYDEMPKWYKLTVGYLDVLLEERNRINADGCLPISHTLYRRAQNIGIKNNKLLVLNGGADTNKINFLNNNTNIKREFGISQEVFVVGLIGINDTEFLNNLKLFQIIKKQIKLGLKIKIVATGNISIELLQKHGFTNNNFISIYNWLPYDDFTKLITTVDLFSLIQENTLRNRSRFPNKLGDYLATGRPIIVNNVGEAGIYAERYPNAFLVIKNDSKSIEEKLLQAHALWKEGKVNYKQIREIAISNSWEKRSIELINFYNKICYNSHKN